MKHLIFLCLALTISLTPALSQSLRLNKTTVDLGEIPMKSNNKVTVTCYNDGDRPLVIRDIQVDCNCTKPSWKKVPVMPGDSAQVTIGFSPTDRGAFYKSIRFVTAPASESPITFILRGKVK